MWCDCRGLLQTTIVNYRKNSNRWGGWGHGISIGIEERACGNSSCQLKKSGISRGTQGKFMWNFHETSFMTMEFQGCHTILKNFQECKIVFSGITKGKVRSSNQRCSTKKSVDLQACNFIKMRFQHRVFTVNIAKF